MNSLFLLLIAAAVPDYWPSQKLKAMIPEREYRLADGHDPIEVIPYRLFVPQRVSRNEKFPLIVWLHGAGESGRDNEMQLKFMEDTIFPDPTDPDRYRFAVLAPQCPRKRGWTEGPSGEDVLSITVKILDDVIAEYPIDAERITAIGISSGGAAAWEMANRYPDRLAAVAPMATTLPSGSSLSQRPVPTWVFLSPTDTTMNIDSARAQVEQLKYLGIPIAITLTSDHPDVHEGNLTHYCFVNAFSAYRLLPWLLAQSRGSQGAPAPGVIEWRSRVSWGYLWPRVGPTLILCVLVVGVFTAIAWYRQAAVGCTKRDTEPRSATDLHYPS